MYYAILNNPFNRRNFLMVAFDYMAERDTFVAHSEFVKVPSAKVQRMSKHVAQLCYNHQRLVFDQDGVRVAHLKSLYVGAAAQAQRGRR